MTRAIPRPQLAGGSGAPELAGGGLAGMEPIYTAAEVAGYLKLDPSTTRRLFLDRNDVIRLGRAEAGKKRSYVSLRIPASAVRAFLRERSR